MKLLQLRFMRLMCDFMLNWYKFRHIPDVIKQKNMEYVNSVREDVVKLMLKEQIKEGL